MTLTNNQIYTYALGLSDLLIEEEQKLPIKINFYLQKNKNTLFKLAQDIEAARVEIAKKYGDLNEDGSSYNIIHEKAEEANAELIDLLNLEQEVQIYQVSIEDFPIDLNLTMEDMEALMFMIKE